MLLIVSQEDVARADYAEEMDHHSAVVVAVVVWAGAVTSHCCRALTPQRLAAAHWAQPFVAMTPAAVDVAAHDC